MLRTPALLLCTALALAGCASTPAATEAATDAATAAPGLPRDAQAPVILVSIDGFRNDYLQRGLTPTLAAMAANGARAEYMRPSYPSITFPNHYTLVTGLRPDRHGIVHNAMSDAGLGKFRTSDRAAMAKSDWWGGVPVWVSVERAGLRSARRNA